MSYYILDVETTGITSKDQIIELAYVPIHENLNLFREDLDVLESNNFQEVLLNFFYFIDNQAKSELFKPNCPIHERAYEVHGIGFSDLKDKKSSENIELPKDICGLIAHNASFDWRMLGKPSINVLCTMKLAKIAWPKNKKGNPAPENYNLEGLIKFLYPKNSDFLLDRSYHRALYDCKLTYLVLLKLAGFFKKATDLEQLTYLCK